MFYFIYSTVIVLLFWKIKKCILTFLYNTIHQYYHNVRIKCIWPVLQQNLNMFLRGICVKYLKKSSSTLCFTQSINIYLALAMCQVLGTGWVYKATSLPSLNLNLDDIIKGLHWYLGKHLNIFVKCSFLIGKYIGNFS